MRKTDKIYVAGHRGLVGSAITRGLQAQGFSHLITRTHKELELLDQRAVERFFAQEKPEYVFLAAAKVGGIMANKRQKADFIYENLEVQNNVIHNAWKYGVKKLLFLGSSCLYPKHSLQPIKEEYLLSDKLEETNDAYAVAKIAGIYMCYSYNQQYSTNFISVMPTNLYGPNDNFDRENSHVLPAMIRKFHDAKIQQKKEVTLWGTGKVFREFLHVDDMANAAIFLMQHYNDSEIINVGCGEEVTIKQLATIIKKAVGYEGKIIWDSSKPDGTPRKLLNVDKLKALGWKPSTSLDNGIAATYQWFLDHYDSVAI